MIMIRSLPSRPPTSVLGLSWMLHRWAVQQQIGEADQLVIEFPIDMLTQLVDIGLRRIAALGLEAIIRRGIALPVDAIPEGGAPMGIFFAHLLNSGIEP